MTYDEWMDQMEIDFVNGELQVIADEVRDREIDVRWEEEIGMQFLQSFDSESVEI